MSSMARRSFLGSASTALLALASCRPRREVSPASAREKGIRITNLFFGYEDYLYRTPIKFGGSVVDRVTLLNVTCEATDRSGSRSVKGFGSMPLGNVWSFPSREMSYETTLGAMKALADRIAAITGAFKESAHPVDVNWTLESAYLEAAAEVSRQLKLDSPIPKLCTLVTASPFDAALHDAYGKMHGVSSFQTYGPELMEHDLSHYLGPEFRGEYLDRYVLQEPKHRMPLYHLVGAVDPIEETDIKKRLNDGLPETLPEWIGYNGLTHIKIKLNGEDLDWDVDRVVRVDRAAEATQAKRGVDRWFYSLDFNEKCRDVGYLLGFLTRLKEKTPRGFERIQYIEQPTKRDLKADRANVMHEAAKIKPVVIDESLVDQESLMLARDMGYTGAALKACKCQSQALLMAAVCQKQRMFLCVQDLTCPGASLIHSASLAAHVPGVAAIEANARQYVPAANKGWEEKFPGLFRISDGTLATGILTRPGLGAV
jgi:L-alanine-DL-glutamate epimerase-like enolase superfamily enzyme